MISTAAINCGLSGQNSFFNKRTFYDKGIRKGSFYCVLRPQMPWLLMTYQKEKNLGKYCIKKIKLERMNCIKGTKKIKIVYNNKS